MHALVTSLAIALACGVVISGCAEDEARSDPTTSTSTSAPALRLDTVADGLAGALLATGRPGDPRLMVVEQGGRIAAIDATSGAAETFLDLSGLTSAGGERGLLGLAFHPDHASNGLLYVNYTDHAGDTVVAEYHAPPDSATVDSDSARVLLTVEQPYANHNGGHLAFGPDRLLYIGMGDGGSGGDPEGHGQRPETLLGAILRIDVDRRDNGLAYGIPPDNPYADRDQGRDEVWVIGVRNPWRFSFDPDSPSDLWIGDVGQNTLEEIDRIAAAADGAGLNLGWNAFEGSEPFVAHDADATYVPPVAQYTHADGCSVTGGVVVRAGGPEVLRGHYLYGDFCSGRVWTLPADGPVGSPREITDAIGGPPGNITSFGRDNDGVPYLVTPDAVMRFAQR